MIEAKQYELINDLSLNKLNCLNCNPLLLLFCSMYYF